jgi:HPt (histidine-containing phosphotransfer) domain-containing protein
LSHLTNPIHSSLAADPDFSDLLLEFVNELPVKLAKIHQLVEDEDMASLRRIFHQLRGACGGYGFPKLSEAAGLIEERISTGEPITILISPISGFMEMLKRVTADPNPDVERHA